MNSKFIGITTLHVSASLSAHHQGFVAVHRHCYILCSFDDRLLPGVAAPGSKQSSKLYKMYNADVRLRTPDDGRKGWPKHVES